MVATHSKGAATTSPISSITDSAAYTATDYWTGGLHWTSYRTTAPRPGAKTLVLVHATRFPVLVAGLSGEMAAWVFTPPQQALNATPLVLVLYPGLVHDKRSWHFVPTPLDGSYSFAQYLVEHERCIVVACDHLGTGESSRPDNGFALSLDVLAEAHAQVADHLRTRLHTGTLAPDLPRLDEIHLGAIGHGMGALILQRVQARFQPYDVVAFLGWTHGVTHYGPVDQEAVARALMPNPHGYVEVPPATRQLLRPFFFLPDVPAALVELDEQQGTGLPAGMLAPLFQPGSVQADAAAITTPVFLGSGEQDGSRNPALNAACYRNAASVTTYVLPNAAHCYHLAPSRHLLWKAIGWWLKRQVAYTSSRIAMKKGSILE